MTVMHTKRWNSGSGRNRLSQLKRSLSMLLAVSLVCGLWAWLPERIAAAGSGDLFLEDFESLSIGAKPQDRWLFSAPLPGTEASVQELEGNRALKLTQSASTASSYWPRIRLDEVEEKAVLEYRVYAEQSNAFFNLPRFTNDSNVELVKLGMSQSGYFAVWDASSNKWQSVRPYEPGQWYNVRLVLDTLTDKYDVYINGQLEVIQRQADATTGPIRHISMGTYRQTVGTFYVDDVVLSSFQEVQGVQFEQSVYEVDVNGSLALKLLFDPADAALQSALWSSSDETIVQVDSRGTVTGIRSGQAEITAIPYANPQNPLTATIGVVGVMPNSITLNKSRLQLSQGARSFLSADVQPANVDDRSVQWSSSNPAVATVDANGQVIALTAGQAVIQAVSALDNALTAECVVEILEAVAKPPGDLLHEDFEAATPGSAPTEDWVLGTIPAHVAITTAIDAGTGNQHMAFSQAETISYSYSARASLPGPASEAVLTYRVRADQNDAYVYLPRFLNESGAELVKIAMNSASSFVIWDAPGNKWVPVRSYTAGEWYDLKLVLDTATDKYDWYINGEIVATQRLADATSGAIAQVGMGLYRLSQGSFAVDDLNVYSFTTAVDASFSQSSYTVPLNGEMMLQLDFVPANASLQSAVWSTDNAAVATVDEQGRVKAVGTGTANVTAAPYAPGLAPTTVIIHVEELLPSAIFAEKSSIELAEGASEYLHAYALPLDASDTGLIWASSNPAVAVVDKGEVTAIAPGQAVITISAASDPAVRQDIPVTVLERSVQHELYVSLQGDDANPGSETLPFRTLQRAQDEVRVLNEQMNGDIVVYIREGTYRLEEALAMNEEDSGYNGFHVIWRAYPGETPIISGGKTIAGWTLHDAERGIYKAAVEPGTQSRQLFVDGVRAVRARSETGLTAPEKTASGYLSGDIALAELTRPGDLEFVYLEQWTNPRIGVASIQLVNNKIRFTMDEPGWTAATNKGGTSATFPAYYENAYELLDEDGEWYLNEATAELFYKPRVWEDIHTVEIVLPVMENLLEVKGSAVEQQAERIRFEGLTFADTTWLRPSTVQGHSDAQNNHLRYPGAKDELPPAAVSVEMAYNIDFEQNTFARIGITALKLAKGVQSSLIRGNRFYDISGGAVNVGDPDIAAANSNPDNPRMRMRNNDILNNYIHDIGVDYMSAAAISAGFPEDMDIAHNEIFNIPYSGLHIGYGWDSVFPNVLRNMKVQHNFIHDLMGKGIYDGGAIYTLGNSGGSDESYNLVSENYIRNQMNDYGPLYPDQGSSYWLFERNVIDVSETPYWKSSASRWTHGNTNREVVFDNNYTTTSNRNSNRPVSVTFTNTHVYPDAAWPQAALDIIGRSGLEEDYESIRRSHAERVKTDSELVLSIGGTGQIGLEAFDGKDRPVQGENLRAYYKLDNPSVAAVDGNGLFTGLEEGQTTVHIYVLDGTILKMSTATVYVGDQLNSISLAEAPQLEGIHLMAGEARTLVPVGVTEMGRTVALDQASFSSSHPELLSVSSEGKIEASLAGEYEILVVGSAGGIERSSTLRVTVGKDGRPLPHALQREISDAGGWYTDKSGFVDYSAEDGSVTIGSPQQFAVYQGATYLNEQLEFEMEINADSGWPSIMFRNQKSRNGIEGTTYIWTIKPDVIELQRFNDGVRTVLFGNIANSPSLGGGAIPNTMLPFRERHHVRLAAVNEVKGVRIVIEVNGEPLIDYLDTAAEAIRNEGYMGIYARSGSITLIESSVPVLAAKPETPVVKVGQEATVRLYWNGKGNAVRELESQATYDDKLLEWVGLQPPEDGKSVATAEMTRPGELRLQWSGSDEALPDEGWPGLVFKAIAPSTEADVRLSDIVAKEPGGAQNQLPPLAISLFLQSHSDGEGGGADSDGGDGGSSGTDTDSGSDLPTLEAEEGHGPVDAEGSIVVPIEAEPADVDGTVKVELNDQLINHTELRSSTEKTLVLRIAEIADASRVSVAWSPNVLAAIGDAREVHVEYAGMMMRIPAGAMSAIAAEGQDEGDVLLILAQADRSKWSAAMNALIGGRPTLHLRIERNGRELSWPEESGLFSVELFYPLAPSERNAPWQLVARLLTDDNNAIPIVNSRYENGRKLLSFRTDKLGVYALTWQAHSFTDIGHMSWAEPAIGALAARDVVNGVSANRYAPQASVTRADFTVLLMRVMQADEGGLPNAPLFADIQPGAYYAPYLQAARSLGVVQGGGDDRFRPEDAISRQEMMVMTARALRAMNLLPASEIAANEEADASELNVFADWEQIAPYALSDLAQLQRAGLIQGSGGELKPGQLSNRAQAATLVWRLTQL